MDQSHFAPYPPAAAAPTAYRTPAWEPPPREIPFRFTGDAQEYFRIWIVNVALTIVTLGIYSAWAKVRTKQYFYRNTWLEDASFEYLADPLRILKGRLLMAAVLGLLFATQFYSLPLYFGLAIVLTLLTPWIVVKALAFNARNSAYRNVRFGFIGNAGEAYGVYLSAVLLYLVTCGLGFPYAQWRLTQFVVNRHLFGDERFAWHTRMGVYFAVFGVALAMSIPIYLVMAGAMAGMAELDGAWKGLVFIPFTLAYALLLVPMAYVRANIANAVYNGLSVGPHGFESRQRTVDLAKLYLTNALAVVVSLGLLTPWAMIRMARYRAEHLTLWARGPLHAGNFDMLRDPNAVGEAASDFGDFGFDVGV